MSNETRLPRLPGKYLTVIIRDCAPYVHMQEPLGHRAIRIELTDEQRRQLALRWTHTIGTEEGYEEVSQVILEPAEGGDEK